MNLSDEFNLKDPNKNMTLASLSIYYTWENVKSAYKNNKFKYLVQIGMMNLICLMHHILF